MLKRAACSWHLRLTQSALAAAAAAIPAAAYVHARITKTQ
jgi:hypothetical protein